MLCPICRPAFSGAITFALFAESCAVLYPVPVQKTGTTCLLAAFHLQLSKLDDAVPTGYQEPVLDRVNRTRGAANSIKLTDP